MAAVIIPAGVRAGVTMVLLVFVGAAAGVLSQAISGQLEPEQFRLGGTVTLVSLGLALVGFCVVDIHCAPTSRTLSRCRLVFVVMLSALLYGIAHLSNLGIRPALLAICAVTLFIAYSAISTTAAHEPRSLESGRRLALAVAAPVGAIAALLLWAHVQNVNEMNSDRPPALNAILDEHEKMRLLRWYDRQRHLRGIAHSPLLVTEYVDYTCPACKAQFLRTTLSDYYWRERAPGKVLFRREPFPLGAGCNPTVAAESAASQGTKHTLACEAAVAVEFAKGTGRSYEMEDWLFAQDQTLTMPMLHDAIAKVGHLDPRVWSSADTISARIAREAKIAGVQGIVGTPTFMLDGVVVPRPGSAEFDLIVEHELARASEQIGTETLKTR